MFVCHRQSKPATKAVRQKKRSSVLWSIKPKLGQWTHFKEACKEFSVEEVSKGLEMFNNSLCLVTVKMLCCRQLFFVFSVMSCYVVPLCKWCYNRIKFFPVFWQKPLDHWVPLHPIKIKTKQKRLVWTGVWTFVCFSVLGLQQAGDLTRVCPASHPGGIGSSPSPLVLTVNARTVSSCTVCIHAFLSLQYVSLTVCSLPQTFFVYKCSHSCWGMKEEDNAIGHKSTGC